MLTSTPRIIHSEEMRTCFQPALDGILKSISEQFESAKSAITVSFTYFESMVLTDVASWPWADGLPHGGFLSERLALL